MSEQIKFVAVEVRPIAFGAYGAGVEVRVKTGDGCQTTAYKTVDADHFQTFFRVLVEEAVNQIEQAQKA